MPYYRGYNKKRLADFGYDFRKYEPNGDMDSRVFISMTFDYKHINYTDHWR